MVTQKGSLFTALAALTNEIQTEKTANAKSRTKLAENPVPADPGGYAGASTHPTAHTDNRGQSVSEGARSSENESDVKNDIPDNVNEASDATPGQQDDVQLNIGTTQSATGEDSSVEDDYKAGKEDPGSSHPARTDNTALDGHKYANASLQQLHDLHTSMANSLLADLANGHGNQLTKQALANAQAGLKPAATGVNQPPQPKPQAAGQAPISQMIEKAAQAVRSGKGPSNTPAANNADLAAGYEVATFLGIEKKAAQVVVAELIEDTIKEAQESADMFGSFYSAYMKKRASEGAAPTDGEDHNGPGDDTSGAGGSEGTGGESSGKPAGGDLGGGESGGPSLGDALGGGSDPGGLMAGGGDPAGGMGGGGGGEEQALMQLAAALDELGIPIEALAAAGGGGGAGGPPPMGGAGGPPPADPMMGGAGGPPPMGGGMGGPPPADPMAGGAGGHPPMGEGMKLASAVTAFKRSGKYKFKAANDGTYDRQLRDNLKSYVRELMQM